MESTADVDEKTQPLIPSSSTASVGTAIGGPASGGAYSAGRRSLLHNGGALDPTGSRRSNFSRSNGITEEQHSHRQPGEQRR